MHIKITISSKQSACKKFVIVTKNSANILFNAFKLSYSSNKFYFNYFSRQKLFTSVINYSNIL